MPRHLLKEDSFALLKEDGSYLLLEADWAIEDGGNSAWTKEPGNGGQSWTPVDGGGQSWTRESGD